jgi:alpha-galactosidase
MLASTPPMGWNSFTSFNASATEEEMKCHADILAAELLPFGYEYLVLDFCWSHPSPKLVMAPAQEIKPDGSLTPLLAMDEYSRQIPAPNRFPTSANGQGLSLLGDYAHGKGLKFGIHIMRGILRQAVQANTPILGTPYHARDIADTSSICEWLNHMYGVDMTRPGAQEYYNSLFQLYASWGVDFIKVDDIAFPYAAAEVEAVQKAIQNSGRAMVLSLSPGPTPLNAAKHVSQNANMWRVSSDFWDSWRQLKEQCRLMADWAPYAAPGHWPDADMLPLGTIEIRGPLVEHPHHTRFTPAEQTTCMTLCAIARSPLMIGTYLPKLDPHTRALLTNREVLAVNQRSTPQRIIKNVDEQMIWAADVPDSSDRYLAFFNLSNLVIEIKVSLKELGLKGPCRVRDLWSQQDLPTPVEKQVCTKVVPHSSILYRLHENSAE